MKLGFLSDAHGNLIALEKCLSYLNKISVDEIYFLGDAVGYYPQGIEVLNRLMYDGIHCLLGNHEAMLLGILDYSLYKEKYYQLEKIKKRISSDLIEFLQNLSPEYDYEIGGKKISLMHGGPSNSLLEYVYQNSDLSEFNKITSEYCFMGHTHYPFVKTKENQTIINVGSCGMPRDNGLLSSFCVLDTSNWEVSILRLEMDSLRIKKAYGNSTHKAIFDLYKRTPAHYTGSLIIE